HHFLPSPLLPSSPDRAAGGDRPDGFDSSVAHTHVAIVEIDRRIAVAGNEFELVADRITLRAVQPDHAVFVGRLYVLAADRIRHARHAGVHAGSLEACINDRALRRRPAHHGGPYE